MRSVAIAIVVLLGLAAVQVAGQGTITIGQIPATPINSVSWQTSAPQYSEWIPIYTNWGDVTRLPSTVTITIDFTSVSTGSLIFITSAAPTATGTSPVTLTLSGTALLNTNTPAGYFAFALVNTDPSSTTAPAPVIRIQASPTTDWPATVGNFPVQVVKRPVKISIVGPANAGMTDIAGGSPTTVSLVPGVLSQPITMEFLLPPQQPIGTVTVQIDPNNNFCGTIGGTTVNCGNFYNFLSWAPDSDTPPSSATGLNTQASWSNVPTGTRKLTFQIATHPSVITNFPPFAQTIVFQAQNGRYPNLAYFPSNNGSASTSYILPNLRLTLSGGDAGQYNPAVTNPGYLFNPVANINQVPVFLTNVNAPQMLTGTTKTFTYTLAHPLPGQSVTYNVLAPPGVTVNPTSFTFSCTTLSGGATGCPTTASVAVTIDNNFINDAYGLVRINVIQPSTSVNYAFPRTIPSIDINIVDRYNDNELIVDSLPAAVAAGQQFTFSMRTRIAPQPGNTINVRLISAEFKFDQPVYALSASNTGFMVTATALSSPLFKTINYPAAQDPSAGYTTGSEIVSVFGFITAIFSGAGARNFIKSGIWDAANSNFGVVVSGAATSTYAENIPAGGIEIYRPQFQYKQATLLNGGSYILTTWDQPSAQITVALKNAPAAGGVALTPVINCAYVTANPSVLTFTTGNNEATFTLTADRNGAVATAANLFGTNPCTVTFAMSGDQTFNYIAPPSFTVAVPTAPYVFTATIEGGLTNTNGNPRTFQIGVTPNFLPRPGNTVTLQPFWALGAFTPASQTWSSADTAFTKTFTVTENDFIDPSLFMGTAIAKLTSITWSVTGPDAGYYTVNALAGPTHATRTVNLPAAPPAITIGRNAMVKISLSDAPTAGTLVLTPVPNVPGALTFTPATYTFTAGAPTTALFQVTGNNIGSWYVEWELTGTDAYLYNSGTGAQFSTFTVGPRGGVTVNIAPPPAGFVSGAWYGPFDARVSGYAAAPLAAGSLTIAPTSDDWKFQPATLAFAANGVSAPFIMRYMPSAPLAAAVDGTSAYDFSTVIEYNLGGTDAWMFPIPAKSNFGVKHRSIVFSDETGASPPALSGPAGVPVLMWITLPDGPAPTGGVTVQLSSDNLLFAQVLGAPGVNGSSGSPALAVSFSGDIVRQQVLVWTNFNGAWGQARQAFPDTLNAKFSIYTTVAGPDAAHYADPADLLQVFTLVKKLFYFDTSSLAASWDNVLNSDGATQQFPLGQVSQVITVGTTGIVSTSVTLTPVCGHVPSEPFSGAGYSGCPYITFSPSELVFTAGQQTASFTFTPVALAPRGAPVFISWSITGADGYAWEIQVSGAPGLGQNIPNELFLQPVPSFKFSPMPAIWIDGKAENLVVTLNQPTGTFPAFQLQIRPSALGVVVEPDILQFSPSGANSQTFAIRHVRPSAIAPTGHFYTLSYSVKYAGATTAVALLPRVVPTDVTEVRLIRYAITPNFPTVLGLDFLKASINLTRAPFADVALVPHLPNFGSGQINVGSNPNSPSLFYPANNQVGVKVPGGRVIFDPPAITFLAGQLVSEFKVRADRLSDNEALYLRVDWEPVFHAEDVNCYYPFAYTWHIAAASTATMAWALVAALAALLLL